jgi:hypothetical protein
MADLSSKKDPLDLKNERPENVEDVSGRNRSRESDDREPAVGGDPEEAPREGAAKGTAGGNEGEHATRR